MVTLLRRFVHDLLFDPDKATLWVRASLGFVGSLILNVIATAPEVNGSVNWAAVAEWGWSGWATRIGSSLFIMLALSFKGGERNPKKEE